MAARLGCVGHFLFVGGGSARANKDEDCARLQSIKREATTAEVI